MFGAVMSQEENCREFLEMVLGFRVERVHVIREKSLIYHPENRGVRLDVYAKDKENKHYNVEMQLVRKPELEKRARYYHGQIDMEMLLSGQDYTELSDAYVIFICDFDPFGLGRYCYTFRPRCVEEGELYLNDGSISIFLNTHGKNAEETPNALVEFLRYVKADLAESMEAYEDEFVKRLQDSVQRVKENRRMEEKYMTLGELLKDERDEGKAEGKAEAVLELLEDYGSIPETVRERIMSETNQDILRKWIRMAARVSSVKQFAEEMDTER